MGQAKLRGTKAERVAEGVAKAQEREYQREKAKVERWRKMTPDERMTAMLLASFAVRHGL